MRRWVPFLAAAGTFLIGIGLQVSGVEYMPIGSALWVAGVLFLFIGGATIGWPTLKSVGATIASNALVSRPARSRFEPYSIQSRAVKVDLSGLWQPDAYLEFTLRVTNTSGRPITMTAVDGYIRCAGWQCNRMPILKGDNLRLSDQAVDDRQCVLRQPIEYGMALELVQSNTYGVDAVIAFDLSDLKWVGTIDLPQGPAPLADCRVLRDGFIVRGPVRDQKEARTLFRVPTTFASSEWYTADGVRKESRNS